MSQPDSTTAPSGDTDTSPLVPIDEVNLHDYVALGEIERGLSQENASRRSKQEIQRLPLFLRVLSLTRPQSSISVFGDGESQAGGDILVNKVVERLEDVVAKHSVAEGVDVVTCHLAPSVTRKLSRVPPLERTDGEWNTKELAAVARNPRSSKRKRKVVDGDNDAKKETDDGIQGSSEEDEIEEEVEEEANQLDSLPNKKQKKEPTRRDSVDLAAADSQEATVTKTLSELASLVVTSLEPIVDNNDTEEAGKTLSLTIDDSILSESAAGAAESGGGAMEGSDLGSTVSAIMHHAPVLRSRQVANALCRTSIPEGSKLMSRMGANCPASVPSLLLGCIEAYSMAVAQGNTSICNVAKQSVTALAKLSKRECFTVLTKLQASNIMLDIQLRLAMEADATAAACLIVNNLSLAENATYERESMGRSSDAEAGTQAPGDASSDFRALEEIDERPIAEGATEPSLVQLLSTNRALFKDSVKFFAKELTKLQNVESNRAIGQNSLVLKALTMLLLIPSKTSPSSDLPRFLSDVILQTLQESITAMRDKIPEPMEVPDSSAHDSLLSLTRCCSVLAAAHISSDDEMTAEVSDKCKSLVMSSRRLPCVSHRSWGFRYCLDFSIKRKNALATFTHAANILAEANGRKICKSLGLFPTLELGMKRLCDMFQEIDVNNDQVNLDSALSALRLEITQSNEEDDETLDSEIKAMLEKILSSETAMEGEIVPKFIMEATDFLQTRGKMQIPLVSYAKLEQSASQLNFYDMEKRTTLSQSQNQFLLQLLHALEFLNLKPKSPFVFDARSFPIKETIRMISATRYTNASPFLEKRLRKLIGKHCAEALGQASRSCSDEAGSLSGSNLSKADVMSHLHDSIRSCVESSDSSSDCRKVEQVFLSAKARLCDADLYTTVIGAFLGSRHKPTPKYSYALVCRDPLALFKCPMRVWRCGELRRIVLATLSSLLETNTAITLNAAPLEDSADELLAARNVLVVRCLLVVVNGKGSDVPVANCSMTTSLIRSIVAGQKGLVATLIKQGLDERTLDWFIEYVPETMNDSQDLLMLLSQHSALTAAEKLQVADAIIRIAIVNGQSNETDSATMAYTALAVLIDSFFLVVGPVGVPVNALMSPDNSGLDVTQIARNAAFRILKSLLLIRGRRSRLRKECGMALQKLAGLCKGESANAGVGGAVAGRRKALLKEIFDAVMRAANSMGSAIGSGSNSTAA